MPKTFCLLLLVLCGSMMSHAADTVRPVTGRWDAAGFVEADFGYDDNITLAAADRTGEALVDLYAGVTAAICPENVTHTIEYEALYQNSRRAAQPEMVTVPPGWLLGHRAGYRAEVPLGAHSFLDLELHAAQYTAELQGDATREFGAEGEFSVFTASDLLFSGFLRAGTREYYLSSDSPDERFFVLAADVTRFMGERRFMMIRCEREFTTPDHGLEGSREDALLVTLTADSRDRRRTAEGLFAYRRETEGGTRVAFGSLGVRLTWRHRPDCTLTWEAEHVRWQDGDTIMATRILIGFRFDFR